MIMWGSKRDLTQAISFFSGLSCGSCCKWVPADGTGQVVASLLRDMKKLLVFMLILMLAAAACSSPCH
jgi:hypothetical protein